MTSITKEALHLVVTISLAAIPWSAFAANSLSFTYHSLGLNLGDSALLLALDGARDAYQVSSVRDVSGRAWIRVTKTNPQGAMVAAYRFGGTGTDTPAAMLTRPAGFPAR